MAENLPDTNVGNIEYIRKADAIKQCGFGMTSLHIANNLRKIPPADVVGKADIMALLEETEKELAKGTDEMSIARYFIVFIMGIVKCKIMQMGEKKDG